MNEKLKSMLTLIARNPAIRTVEIADHIDCDVDQVQPLLQPMIDAGEILLIPVTAPNGRPANGFMFTEKGRKGELFRELSEERRVAQAASMPAHAPAIPAAPDQLEQPVSKIETAIRFIRAQGSAAASEIRDLLKLEKGQSPMAYLGNALRDGRLKVSNGIYTLGDGQPEKAAAPKPARQPKAAKPVPDSATEPVVKRVSNFRCALWSDGKLELQRNGVTIASLTDEEQAIIMEFRRNVAAAVQGAV